MTERTVSDKSLRRSGLIRERIENAGDILRELSSRGDRPDPGYIQEKIDKLRSWIPDNASVRNNRTGVGFCARKRRGSNK
jgi:hypothetical protein